MKRAMKQENSKHRNSAKKEFSQAVRNLTKSIRSKDPRYLEIIKLEQKEREEKDRRIRKELLKKKLEQEEQMMNKVEEANVHYEESVNMNQHFVSDEQA